MSLAVLAAIISAGLHPFMVSAAKRAAHPLTVNALGCFLAAIVFSFVYFDPDFWTRFLVHWKLVVFSGFLHIAYISIALTLITRHEFQVLYPLTRLAPILILIGEVVVFGTEFLAIQIFGIMSVVAGALILGFDHKIAHVRTQVFLGILLITLLVAGFHLTDKQLVQYFTASEMWALIFTQLPFPILVLLIKQKEGFQDLKNWKNTLFYAFAMIGTWYFAIFALRELDAAIVASLRNLSILLGVFLGAHLFDEGHRWWRYVAAGLIILGAVMVV